MTSLTATTLPAALALSLAACSGPEPTYDSFESTGELIALSGGDAGAQGACVTCHGLEGEGDGNLVPRLAGLDPGYFARQMEYFAEGQRRHPQMTWIADRLGWPARQKLAQYYAELPVPEGTATNPSPQACAVADLYHSGDPERGIASCASCHGDNGKGAGRGNPPLAAQPAPYLAEQLKAWASGKRYDDPGESMTLISQLLTEPEMERLARYSAALPGAGAHPEPRASCLPERRPGPRSGA